MKINHLLLAAAALSSASALAATLNWDPGLTGTSTGGGTGTWNTTNTNWWNGSIDTTWTDTTGVDNAVFGNAASAATVTLGSATTANALTFNSPNYTVTGSTLTLAGTTPTITVTNGADTATISSVIAGGGGLTKAGSGTLTLTGANTYSGATIINSGTLTLSAAVYHRDNYTAISGAGSLRVGTSGTYFYGLHGNISGLTGTVTVAGLVQNRASALGSASAAFVQESGSTLLISNDDTANLNVIYNMGSLAGNGTVAGSGYVAGRSGTKTLSVGSLNTDTTYSGVIANGFSGGGSTVALTKVGTGTQTLSGASTYTGGTTVNAGTLLAGHNSAFGTGGVTVNSGGTLNTGLAGTNRTIANAITVNTGGKLMGVAAHTGTVTINAGGTLAPGNSPGIQTFSGGLSFASGAAYEWEFLGNSPAVAGADFDSIVLTAGTLSVADGALFKVTGLGVDYANSFWTSDRTFLVVDAQGTAAIAGNFTTDTSAAGAFAGRGSWSLNTANGDLYAVWTAEPTAVPEPSTCGLLGAGAFAAIALVRRRRMIEKTT